ncbi:hypothetical protein DFH08DRAFT_976477 [Mycena albidolilacea]|uniref:Uncharacterized protein n=1 Tax=Mycena albidolilacea TaxID=1033008 RepID=A0AAD6Z378_9AGAR|nr:hypothetical protein DFH08DRAFT_976477 [Mycena albidolilacea]
MGLTNELPLLTPPEPPARQIGTMRFSLVSSGLLRIKEARYNRFSGGNCILKVTLVLGRFGSGPLAPNAELTSPTQISTAIRLFSVLKDDILLCQPHFIPTDTAPSLAYRLLFPMQQTFSCGKFCCVLEDLSSRRCSIRARAFLKSTSPHQDAYIISPWTNLSADSASHTTNEGLDYMPSLPFAHALRNHMAAPSSHMLAACYSACRPAPACALPTSSSCRPLCVRRTHPSPVPASGSAGDYTHAPPLSPVIPPRVSAVRSAADPPPVLPRVHTPHRLPRPPACCHARPVPHPPRPRALPARPSRSASTPLPPCAATPVPSRLHPRMLRALVSVSTRPPQSASTPAPLACRVLITAGGAELMQDDIVAFKKHHACAELVVQKDGRHEDMYVDFMVKEKKVGSLTPLTVEWLAAGFQETPGILVGNYHTRTKSSAGSFSSSVSVSTTTPSSERSDSCAEAQAQATLEVCGQICFDFGIGLGCNQLGERSNLVDSHGGDFLLFLIHALLLLLVMHRPHAAPERLQAS